MVRFLDEQQPPLESYWRAIVLFGMNVASYKFALGKSLLGLAQNGITRVTLEDLAVPFSTYVVEHLRNAPKQATSPSSKFLNVCQQYIDGTISQDALTANTVKLGFVNVLDAFHIVNQAEIPVRFFADARKDRLGGIILSDELLHMAETISFTDLPQEIEARWRLVETAWELNMSRNLLVVRYDGTGNLLFTEDTSRRRVDITSSRAALNGYQKGKCFYCFGNISVMGSSPYLADVDHFFPHSLKQVQIADPIDGVWNLVLACPSCNRGSAGKFALLPAKKYLERLYKRNEFYINSHHPLRETLIHQTGASPDARAAFLRSNYEQARNCLIHTWETGFEHEPAF